VTGTGAKAAVTVERISYRQCLTPVRAFYLDLAHWALEEPDRWAAWAVPCPVGAEEINQRKAARHRKSRMDARTRERLPVLPVLVRAIDERRKNAGELSSRIWRRNSLAFLDDDAAAAWIPASLTAMMNRSASG
jgi:hypothetical protein